MAHELSIRTDGTAELMLADKGAWHHFGTIVDGAFSAQDAITQVIPWTADQLATFAHAPCGSPQEKFAELWGSKFHRTKSSAIFRSDTGACIGEVGAGYTPIQPRPMFAWVDAVCEGSPYKFESAGALRGGSVLFVSARVGEINILGSGDIIRSYLAFVNSFDGSLAAQAYWTGTRMVCMNTVIQSLANSSHVVRFKHTKNVQSRMDKAAMLMQGVAQTEASIKEKLETLAKRTIRSKETYTKVLDSLFPGEAKRSENIKRDVTDLWQNNDNNAFPEWKGTAYSLYNAVTRYTDHMRTTRGDDKQASRFESAILGSGAKLKEQALETILTLTDGTELSHVTYFDVPVVPVG